MPSTDTESELQRLLDQATELAVKVYGPGSRAVLKTYCAHCVHPIHLSSLGWKHDSFSAHQAVPSQTIKIGGIITLMSDEDPATDIDTHATELVATDREAAQAQVRFLGGLLANVNSNLTNGQAANAMRGRDALIRELMK